MDRLQVEAADFFAKLTAALSTFPLGRLENPTLNFRVFVQEGNSADDDNSGTFEANEQHTLQSGHLLLSVRAVINRHTNSWHELRLRRNLLTNLVSIKFLYAVTRASTNLQVRASPQEKHPRNIVYQPIRNRVENKKMSMAIKRVRDRVV
jgi:hypothetical protein